MSLETWDWETEVRPPRGKVLIAPDLPRSKAGFIILPEDSRRQSRQGRVVRVGEPRLTKVGAEVPYQVKTGDRVIFLRQFGTWEEVEQGEYLILPEENILAIREKKTRQAPASMVRDT